jgi:hypothetical protein
MNILALAIAISGLYAAGMLMKSYYDQYGGDVKEWPPLAQGNIATPVILCCVMLMSFKM